MGIEGLKKIDSLNVAVYSNNLDNLKSTNIVEVDVKHKMGDTLI